MTTEGSNIKPNFVDKPLDAEIPFPPPANTEGESDATNLEELSATTGTDVISSIESADPAETITDQHPIADDDVESQEVIQ